MYILFFLHDLCMGPPKPRQVRWRGHSGNFTHPRRRNVWVIFRYQVWLTYNHSGEFGNKTVRTKQVVCLTIKAATNSQLRQKETLIKQKCRGLTFQYVCLADWQSCTSHFTKPTFIIPNILSSTFKSTVPQNVFSCFPAWSLFDIFLQLNNFYTLCLINHSFNKMCMSVRRNTFSLFTLEKHFGFNFKNLSTVST